MNDILANANNSLILSLSKDEPISPMEARASTGSARAVFFFLQKSLIRRFLFPAALIIGAVLRAAEGPVPPLPDFAPGDRVLFLSPHPDDEVLGGAGILQKALAKGAAVRVVFLTYGDNYEGAFWAYKKHPVLEPSALRQMGELRHKEALAAGKILGLSPEDEIFLGYPDWGTLPIWLRHWAGEKPLRSMLTRVTEVPYPAAYRPGAPYKGEEILRDVEAQIREFRPTKIFVSHPADQHPDHEALYLFTAVALWEASADVHPSVECYLVHFKNWPRPRGLHPDLALTPPMILDGSSEWRTESLSPKEIAVKRNALDAHHTQRDHVPKYLFSFVRNNELFGNFPPLSLSPEGEPVPLRKGAMPPPDDGSEDLAPDERERFVGLESKDVSVRDGRLVVRIVTSRSLAGAATLSVYAFGWRADKPFGEMPKLHLLFGPFRHVVRDQSRALPSSSVIVRRHPREIEVEIPLDLLGRPERILTSARTSLLSVPLDWTAWRIVEGPALSERSPKR